MSIRFNSLVIEEHDGDVMILEKSFNDAPKRNSVSLILKYDICVGFYRIQS
jgi:hypothetical protein